MCFLHCIWPPEGTQTLAEALAKRDKGVCPEARRDRLLGKGLSLEGKFGSTRGMGVGRDMKGQDSRSPGGRQ